MAPKDIPHEPEPQPTAYDLIGGETVVRRIVERFYDIMDSAPEAAGIRAMHASDLGPMRESLFEFLSGWLGGPRTYFERPGAKCVVSAHRPFAIGEAERDAWMLCMRRAMDEAGVTGEMRTKLDHAFMRVAEAFRSRGPGREGHEA